MAQYAEKLSPYSTSRTPGEMELQVQHPLACMVSSKPRDNMCPTFRVCRGRQDAIQRLLKSFLEAERL
jgi:hypothetical protein